MKCKWLPPLMLCIDWSDFPAYDDQLYEIFKKDFIISHPYFGLKQVQIRSDPLINGREYTYYHITSKNYSETDTRLPDPRRCERIKWIRKFIENYRCDPSLCDDCNGIKLWEEDYKNTKRIYLLSEEEKYVVILERRKKYILLITAYYLDYEHSLKKLLKKYNANKTEGA